MPQIEMTKAQMVQVLHGLRLRKAELERFNPNMRVPEIDAIIDLEITLADVLSGVPVQHVS
jgi:hypothetical protein